MSVGPGKIITTCDLGNNDYTHASICSQNFGKCHGVSAGLRTLFIIFGTLK
jgi:hypothetical protein